MLDASRLSHRVTIERRQNVNDGRGNRKAAFASLLERWADIRTLTGREVLSGATLQSEVNAVVTLRADPQTRLIEASDRLVVNTGPHQGLIAAIIAVRRVTAREIEIDISFGKET